MTKLDPVLFAKLVNCYIQEFGELFQVAEEQQDTFERNREILTEIVETDKPTICDSSAHLLDNNFGVVSSDHPVAAMGMNVLQWIFRRTKSYLETHEQTYQLMLRIVDLLTGIVRVVFIIVGSFRSVLEDGSYIPNNKTCRSIWEDVRTSMELLNSLVLEAYELLLTDFHLKAKYEIPNRLQSISDFVSLRIPCDPPTIPKRYIDSLTIVIGTMLANFSEITFALLLSCRECSSDESVLLLTDIIEEISDEANDIMRKLKDKWADFIKYSEEEICDSVSAHDDYIKRIKHSKEYILLKETSKLRSSLREFDGDLEELEKSGFDKINQQFPPEQIAEVFQNYSEVYQQKLEVVKSALERHEFLFYLLNKANNSKFVKPIEDTCKQADVQENSAVEVAEDKPDEIQKLEYENEATENDDQLAERDNIGDEFFQTKGGLGIDFTDVCVESEDAREQEKLFKFVVRELKGKLTDVSLVMKEREKKAKRKIYGDESSSDEEDDITLSNEATSGCVQESQRNRTAAVESDSYELEGMSNPRESEHEEKTLACEGFPAFFNTELQQALKLRLNECVAEEFEYSDTESDD